MVTVTLTFISFYDIFFIMGCCWIGNCFLSYHALGISFENWFEHCPLLYWEWFIYFLLLMGMLCCGIFAYLPLLGMWSLCGLAETFHLYGFGHSSTQQPSSVACWPLQFAPLLKIATQRVVAVTPPCRYGIGGAPLPQPMLLSSTQSERVVSCLALAWRVRWRGDSHLPTTRSNRTLELLQFVFLVSVGVATPLAASSFLLPRHRRRPLWPFSLKPP